MNDTFDDLRFAVIDVEGNGQQPPEIIEIAIVPVDGVKVGEPATWLVRPERPITPIVTRKVHGIRNADVADAPTWAEVEPDVAAALTDRVPVAHNAKVEHDVLRRHMPWWEPTRMLDTLRLARAVWPGLGAYGLDRLVEHAGLTLGGGHGQRHRAGFDAYATALLFVALAETTSDRDRLFSLAGLPGLTSDEEPQGKLW
ncbi:MAG: 3'-5' exonuclease [Pseudonocardiaceae bacterium]